MRQFDEVDLGGQRVVDVLLARASPRPAEEREAAEVLPDLAGEHRERVHRGVTVDASPILGRRDEVGVLDVDAEPLAAAFGHGTRRSTAYA